MRRFTGTIPEDLIRDILLRLPSQTVVELKLVCKSWLALISSPNFPKAHLAITAAEENDVLHIVRTYANGNKSISLINLGFGFDEIDNDFKILRVAWRLKPKFSHRKYYARDCEEIYVEVYSSNTNAWQKLGDNKPTDLPYKFGEFHVTVNTGLLCWAGCYGIITFDLHTEVLTCDGINYPVPTFDSNMSNINNYNDMDSHALVTNFKDSIAVIIYKRSNYQRIYKLNLWALDNVECLRGGGIDASWTLIFNIDVNLPIDFVQGYLNSGDLLLDLYQNSWYLYNPDNKEAKYFTQSFYLGQIYKYCKSLFTIPGFKQVNWNAPPEAS
ncbi:F-box/WD-40 repeat-containing protein 1-like [Apium graveolens]|uniref:F-box/WD-40 repeat-containing protein 1-like n=1 Tax=Apium graveolens TaxID=4045 RepID=UPI003D79CDE2